MESTTAPPRPAIVVHPPLSNFDSDSTLHPDRDASTSRKCKHKHTASEPMQGMSQMEHQPGANNRNSTATTLIYNADSASTPASLPRPEPITIVLTFWEHCLWVLAPLFASAVVGGIMLFLILHLNAPTAVIIVCILAYFALSFLLIGITGLEMRIHADRKWEKLVERRTQYPWHSEALPLAHWRRSWPGTVGTGNGLAGTGDPTESDDPASDQANQRHRLQHHRQSFADGTCSQCIELEREQYRLHYEPDDHLDIGAESVRGTENGTLTYGAAVREKDPIPRATYKQHQWTYGNKSKWPGTSTYDPSMYSKARMYDDDDDDDDDDGVNYVPRLSPNLYGLATSASSRATRGSLAETAPGTGAATPAFSKAPSSSTFWNVSPWQQEGQSPMIDHTTTGAGAHDDGRTEDGYMAGSSRGASSEGKSAATARATSPPKGYPQTQPANPEMSLSGRTLVPPGGDSGSSWMGRSSSGHSGTSSGTSKGKESSPTRKHHKAKASSASGSASPSKAGSAHGHALRPSLDRSRSGHTSDTAVDAGSGSDVHLEPGDARILHSPRIWADGERDVMLAYAPASAPAAGAGADKSATDLSLSLSGVKTGSGAGSASRERERERRAESKSGKYEAYW